MQMENDNKTYGMLTRLHSNCKKWFAPVAAVGLVTWSLMSESLQKSQLGALTSIITYAAADLAVISSAVDLVRTKCKK